jgi:aryl-alcohol dehydrogenase-like predicted oxidoreductase
LEQLGTLSFSLREAGMRGQGPAELVVGSVQLGCAYGAANRTGKPSRALARRIVSRAVDAGVTQFDTARAYGDAEERLGEALEGRKPVHIVTKLSPLTDLAPNASREAVREAVDRSIRESLDALRARRLDCLLLHRAGHMTAFNGAVWERLIEHLEEGTLLALGVSVQSPEEAHAVLERRDVRHIQLPFNLLDWRWRDAGVIDALAQKTRVTVHARSIYLQGLLAAGDASVWPRIDGVDAPRLVRWLQDCATAFGRRNAADLALAYMRAQRWIDGVVIGMETLEQLDANLEHMAQPPLSGPDCARIEAERPRLPVTLLDPAQWPKQVS